MPKLQTPAAAPNTKKKGAAKKAAAEPAREVLYPRYDVRLFVRDPAKAVLGEDGQPLIEPMTAAIAKEFLGWQVEADGENFADNYLLIDKNGKKARCTNNLLNRPFYPQLAEDWMLEVLRLKWQMNGEQVIIDEYGMVHDGQHRLIGLILAEQTWLLDQKKPKDQRKWAGYWKEEPCIDCSVFLGIKGTDEVVNTINTGKPRSLADVLFRSACFRKQDTATRLVASKVLNAAIKTLWYRTSQQLASSAPRRPHSESLEFLANHERLLECVKFIQEEGDDGKLAPFLPHGPAACLLYLMGSAASDGEAYVVANTEKVLDWSLWDKAQSFWVDLAANGKATEALREALLKIPAELGGKYNLDLRCATLIKAWNLYSDGKKLTLDTVEVETSTNELGQPILAEMPRCGGIDVEYGDDSLDEPTTPAAKDDGVNPLVDGGGDECLKGGKHEYTTEKGVNGVLETFCKKCLDPKKPKRKGK